jgi:large subunit ribosomal protein L17
MKMNHRIGFNRLSRTGSHRKAMTRNMVTSIFRYERIKTTKAKALEIRRTAEKMITRAKVDSVHNRRVIAKDIKDKEILAKLFTDIAPRYKTREGGYTRILKLGRRAGDAAEIVFLELVETENNEKSDKKDKKKKKAAEKPAETKKEEVKAEAPVEADVETKTEEVTAE